TRGTPARAGGTPAAPSGRIRPPARCRSACATCCVRCSGSEVRDETAHLRHHRDVGHGGGDAVIFYKVLRADGTPCHGGTSRWHLPTADGPGEWMPAIPDPVPCRRGYHLCRDAADLLAWLGPTIWVAEAAGAVIAHRDKVVVERARLLRRLPWDERTAREFAADCAERA